MSESIDQIRYLSDLEQGHWDQCYALLSAKESKLTKAGKPYFKITFADANRSASLMVWHDSNWYDVCDQNWSRGDSFFLRCRLVETNYGLQIELDEARPVNEQDDELGFSETRLFASAKINPEEKFDELITLIEEHISEHHLKQLVVELTRSHRDQILVYPAASRNHHAYRSGYLVHVVSVTRNAILLADKYLDDYPQLDPPLSKDLVVAGAVLHDIGKLIELDGEPSGANYTPQGRLIGHILLGRDMIREAANCIENFPAETLLRLEHIIVSHQNLKEWGSPIAPHTPEALLVHYADDIDAKFEMMASALRDSSGDDNFSSNANALRRPVFRGLEAPEK